MKISSLSLGLCLLAGPLVTPLSTHAATPAAPATLHYGPDATQVLDFVPAQNAHGPVPLIVFVHGGAWMRGSKEQATGRYKAAHFTGEGYNFATIDYRLVPQATVEQQAQDVADAVAALLKRADALGIDRSRVVLMGHSAGAQLVALVGTDPKYMKAAGLRLDALSGVIPIDGAAYDVAGQMAETRNPFMRTTYDTVFGEDPARQRALSPVAQAAAPNAPAFLLLHVERVDGIAQAKELEAALQAAGTHVARAQFPGRGLAGHIEINKRLGEDDYPPTLAVDAWLKQLFA
jgi:acetyl esterase/lipase